MLQTLIYIGLVTDMSNCHDFACKSIRIGQTKCQVKTVLDTKGKFGTYIGHATYAGETYKMHWFKDGPDMGLHGQNGTKTLALFYSKGKLKTAYQSTYSTKHDYVQTKCEI